MDHIIQQSIRARCGNGGSAADAQHLAAELSGRFYYDRPPLNSEALHCNTSYLTAVANDYGYDLIYSRMIDGACKKGDVLIGISTSGNSKNVCNAFEKAHQLVEKLTQFVYNGGAFIGVNEPSAVPGYHTFFRMAHVLGIDEDTGARVCHGKWEYDVDFSLPIDVATDDLKVNDHLYLTDGKAKVLWDAKGCPQMTVNRFGKGLGIYMSDFAKSNEANRMLLDILLYAANLSGKAPYVTDDYRAEAAYYPASHALIVINNADEPVDTFVSLPDGAGLAVSLKPLETKEISL